MQKKQQQYIDNYEQFYKLFIKLFQSDGKPMVCIVKLIGLWKDEEVYEHCLIRTNRHLKNCTISAITIVNPSNSNF